MSEFLSLLLVAFAIILTVQFWLFVDSLRGALAAWLYEVLSLQTWQARDKAAVTARKAQESARWKDEQGQEYQYDFDADAVRQLAKERQAVIVPNERQWQVALVKACGWGELIGWTEKAWRENRVVYLPDTGEHYETGRRQIIAELDRLGITAGGALGRTWAAGMDYKTTLDLIDSTPPRPEWAKSPPPAIKLPYEAANPRNREVS